MSICQYLGNEKPKNATLYPAITCQHANGAGHFPDLLMVAHLHHPNPSHTLCKLHIAQNQIFILSHFEGLRLNTLPSHASDHLSNTPVVFVCHTSSVPEHTNCKHTISSIYCHDHATNSTFYRQCTTCKRWSIMPLPLSFVFLLVREVIDNTGKENGIDIVMAERTYHLIADNAEDAR